MDQISIIRAFFGYKLLGKVRTLLEWADTEDMYFGLGLSHRFTSPILLYIVGKMTGMIMLMTRMRMMIMLMLMLMMRMVTRSAGQGSMSRDGNKRCGRPSCQVSPPPCTTYLGWILSASLGSYYFKSLRKC